MPTPASGNANRTASAAAAVNTPVYTAAYNEVKEIGRVDSATRTPEQTDIAKMRAAGAGTVSPPGMWHQVAQQLSADTGPGILGEARLFGLMGLAAADAAISCRDAKHAYNGRRVTAIQLGDADGNSDTVGLMAARQTRRLG